MRDEDWAPRHRDTTTTTSDRRHIVQETKSRAKDASNNQILFPMAVGALFLAVLVAGALLG